LKVKKIILKNLFSYHGVQEINFDKRTLILAENGFGKTSLLNAIKVGLGEKKFHLDSILNSHAFDKECFIEIDFSDFILKRVWDLEENFEDITIHLGEEVLKAYEAEAFLKEKFPSELIDFIFFDGEVEKEFILLKSQKIKKLFEYVFDLDILSHMIIDTKRVAKKLSSEIGNKEVLIFQGLQEEESRLTALQEKKEQERGVLAKSLQTLNERIRLNDLKIKNRSKAVEKLEERIEKNYLQLAKEIEIFQEINLYQLPLILNPKLFARLQNRQSKSIEILDKRAFEKSFENFLEELESAFSKEVLLEKFYRVFRDDKKILSHFTQKQLVELIHSI
jgi:DNA sulfur modification protein DndD